MAHHHHEAGAALARSTPLFVRRALIAGPPDRAAALTLRMRPNMTVNGLTLPDDVPAPLTTGYAHIASAPLDPADPVAQAPYDAIIFDRPEAYWPEPAEAVIAAASLLAPRGYLLMRFRNAAYFASGGAGTTLGEAATWLQEAGLVFYVKRTAEDPRVAAATPDAGGQAVIEGVSVSLATPEQREAASTVEYVLMAVQPDYNPMLHGQALFEQGRPDWTYNILELIPEVYLQDPEAAATVYGDMQFCQLAQSQQLEGRPLLRNFFLAQVLFYRVIERAPLTHDAYCTQADFWLRLGGAAMGRRLLASIQRAAPMPELARMIAAWPEAPPRERDLAPPALSIPDKPPRVLMLMTADRPHFGMDVLYDGLCDVLGETNVIDYPFKPTLHGQTPRDQANYPCVLNRGGAPKSLDAVAAELEAGAFDFVLFADFEQELDQAAARRIMDAAGETPLFLLDAQDDPCDNRPEALEFLGRLSAAAYFKREMLACYDYGQRTYPMPFAYPENRALADISGPRTRDLFWAGHRRFGLRRLYLERVEALTGARLDASFSQEEYARALREARAGLSVFGFGYDTVRYWELPAHGCLLIAEQLPICVPHDFRDGETALLFDDLAGLEERVQYALAQPDRAAEIAQAGHAHYRRHHTAAARARQLLAWADAVQRAL